ncbi:MAG: hypothetical protein CEE38_06260 [Planctomycetes bacterium B3_Pla]|nr:MAG: hypothetical protein CEE38_06260 [Planctomycetes bacterium B3_Pla]
MHIVASDETVLLVIKFKVGGDLRFLSHAETLRLFQRACVRAGINIRYSRGFNPRPRLSLPLPRSVGVESGDELLCLKVNKDIRAQEHKSTGDAYGLCSDDFCTSVAADLSAQLPDGCELVSVNIAPAGASFQPRSATYVLILHEEYLNEELRARIERLLASESLNVRRRTGARNSKSKNVDVRPFLTSLELNGRGIIVECRISPAGSIRIDEILNLLGLDESKLAAPIRRTNVKWKDSES